MLRLHNICITLLFFITLLVMKILKGVWMITLLITLIGHQSWERMMKNKYLHRNK